MTLISFVALALLRLNRYKFMINLSLEVIAEAPASFV